MDCFSSTCCPLTDRSNQEPCASLMLFGSPFIFSVSLFDGLLLSVPSMQTRADVKNSWIRGREGKSLQCNVAFSILLGSHSPAADGEKRGEEVLLLFSLPTFSSFLPSLLSANVAVVSLCLMKHVIIFSSAAKSSTGSSAGLKMWGFKRPCNVAALLNRIMETHPSVCHVVKQRNTEISEVCDWLKAVLFFYIIPVI